MNVGPAQNSSPGVDRQTPEKKAPAAPSNSIAVSENGPKVETAKTQNSPVPSLIPEHEVKVQWDTPADQIMVYRVLDKQSGDLVLQVPSAEVLSGMHQTQELLQRIAARGKIPAANASSDGTVKAEEKNHGNKL
jgi:hypothetical protein